MTKDRALTAEEVAARVQELDPDGGITASTVRKYHHKGITVIGEDGRRKRMTLGRKLFPDAQKSPLVFTESDVSLIVKRASKGQPGTRVDVVECSSCGRSNGFERVHCRHCGAQLRQAVIDVGIVAAPPCKG